MSAGQGHAASDLIATALACYRAPARYGDILRGNQPVPTEITILFRLAGGSGLAELGIQGYSERDLDELRAAARFYIEQTLFRKEADYYRLLGLRPGAEDDQVKEHHRLLMRLFHPDRLPDSNDWKDNYVNRINQAYDALRAGESRARYAAGMAATLAEADLAAPQRQRVHVVSTHRPGYGGDYPQAAKRSSHRAPFYVMSGIVVLAVLFVASVYLSNQPRKNQSAAAADAPSIGSEAIAAERSGSHTEPIELSRELEARLDDLIAMDRKRVEQASEPRPPTQVDVQASAPDAKRRPSVPQVQPATRANQAQNQREMQTQPRELAVTVPISPPIAVRPSGLSSSGAPSLRLAGEIRAAEKVDTPAAQPVGPQVEAAEPPAKPDVRQISILELENLLFKYVLNYERGDVTGFMTLFDESARSGSGGKTKIRQDYERFFMRTQMRNLDFGQPNWKGTGDTYTSKIPYRVTTRLNGESEVKLYTGVLYFEVSKRDDKVAITALFDSSGGQP